MKIIIFFKGKDEGFLADKAGFELSKELTGTIAQSARPGSDVVELLKKYPKEKHLPFDLDGIIGNPNEKDIEKALKNFTKVFPEYFDLRVVIVGTDNI